MGYSKVVRKDQYSRKKKIISQKTYVNKCKTFKRNNILEKHSIVLFFEILYALCASAHSGKRPVSSLTGSIFDF